MTRPGDRFSALTDFLLTSIFVPMSLNSLAIEDILGPNGLLARSLQAFEFRPSQQEMAFLIEQSLQKEIPAIVEAGTGTGKTFGYLVPLMLSGKKAVISTGTKNLQEQIYFRDLRLLQEATGHNIDAMMMKGRKNYVCLHRYHQHVSQRSLLEEKQGKTRQMLNDWLENTEFADRSELAWLPDDDPLWDSISSTSEQCLGADCLYLEACYLSMLRNRAARSKIIIVNHHLFFADLKVKKGGFGEIIPRFQVAVFDEAHNIEDVATAYMGESLSTSQLLELIGDLEREIKDLPDSDSAKIRRDLDVMRASVQQMIRVFDGQDRKGRLDPDQSLRISEDPARQIHRRLQLIKGNEMLRNSDNAVLHSLVSRAEELDLLLEKILSSKDPNWLNWYEKRKRTLVFHASPLDISERINELLYKKVRTVIFTSATLSTNGNFHYIRSRLGIPGNALEGIYPSHFDFGTQTLMYVPKDLPIPNDPGFGSAVAERILDILKRSKGRALVLFTSYQNLNLVWEILKAKAEYNIYRQGDAPRSVVLDAFRKDVHSVLLATGSFWQGVDVPGETLSCLIIDKLPFDSPGEPLVSARIDAIRDRGGNPFMEYQVPSAIISLKQGLGRLIRNSDDMGILCVLDTRLLISRYGKFFLNSLPQMPITYGLADIDNFFEKLKGET